MSRASSLLSLQQIDDRIATLTSEIAVTEASLRGDPELDRLRAAETAAHEQHRALGSSAKLAELEAASLQARIRELDRKLYGGTVRNPAELMEMQRELDAMRVKLSTAEDDALGRMEAVDVAEASLATASAAVAARDAPPRSNRCGHISSCSTPSAMCSTRSVTRCAQTQTQATCLSTRESAST